MNCHEYRNHLTQASLSRLPLAVDRDSALAAHHETCTECRQWAAEQLELDRFITAWVQETFTGQSTTGETPAVDLTDRITAAALHELQPQASSASKNQSIASRKLSFSRTGLAALLATLAASLLFVLPQLSLNLPQTFNQSQLASDDTLDSDPVVSIVSSVRNVVGNVAATPSTAVAKLPSSSFIPNWQVGTIQFSGSDNTRFPTPRWADVREDLQPLESEVKQAFDFIWSALPPEEI